MRISPVSVPTILEKSGLSTYQKKQLMKDTIFTGVYDIIATSYLVYPRLTYPVLEDKQKDIFILVHGIYKNGAAVW